MGEWQNIPADIENYFGFVYCITNKVTGKKYIGKKFFWYNDIRPPLKKSGKKRNRKERKQTDWREYYGSSRQLQEDLAKYGKENFEREILLPCKTRFDCAYHETRIQIERNVLFDETYLNGIINLRVSRPGKRK